MDKYVVPVTSVKEVKETISVNELNALIRSGWMLLSAATSNNHTLFSLGRVSD